MEQDLKMGWMDKVRQDYTSAHEQQTADNQIWFFWNQTL